MGCGKSFIPTRSDQRFCSSSCRNRAWIKKHPRVVAKPKQLSNMSPDESATQPGEASNVLEVPDDDPRNRPIGMGRTAITAPGVWNEPV